MKALGRLLRAAHPYCTELDVTLLFPRHRLPLPLDGDTPEERIEELIYKCSGIFEAVVDASPPDITYRFVRWFCKVFRTEIPAPQMLQVLTRVVKRECRTTL